MYPSFVCNQTVAKELLVITVSTWGLCRRSRRKHTVLQVIGPLQRTNPFIYAVKLVWVKTGRNLAREDKISQCERGKEERKYHTVPTITWKPSYKSRPFSLKKVRRPSSPESAITLCRFNLNWNTEDEVSLKPFLIKSNWFSKKEVTISPAGRRSWGGLFSLYNEAGCLLDGRYKSKSSARMDKIRHARAKTAIRDGRISGSRIQEFRALCNMAGTITNRRQRALESGMEETQFSWVWLVSDFKSWDGPWKVHYNNRKKSNIGQAAQHELRVLVAYRMHCVYHLKCSPYSMGVKE